MIQYQILQINITRNIWLTVRRITNEILGEKGLSLQKSTENMSKHSNKDNMKRKKTTESQFKIDNNSRALTNLANLLCSRRVTIRIRSIAYCSFALVLASLYV